MQISARSISCLVLSLLVLSCGEYPVDAIYYDNSEITDEQYDTLFGKIEFNPTNIRWPAPKYKLWEYWYGTGWYRCSDTELVAYGDTIIRPDFSGWFIDFHIRPDWTYKTISAVTPYGSAFVVVGFNDGSFDTVESRWSNNNVDGEFRGWDGIKANGMPYWLDSLRITSYNISNQPLVSSDYIAVAPFWYPSVFPSYVKWRDKTGEWAALSDYIDETESCSVIRLT